MRDVLFVCLGIKCLLLALGVVAGETRLDRPFRQVEDVLGLWNQWDTKHYLAIAENGYLPPREPFNLVFPPFLPGLIRAGSALTGSIQSAGVVVATLISFLPGLLLFQLARLDLGDEDAFRAALLLLLFPTGFFLHLVYTESLFLTLVLGAFLAARKGRWRTVAALGVLAGLTRINAFVLAPALLAEAWGAPGRGRVARLAAALSVGLGIVIYLGINYWVASDPFAFLAIQKASFYRTFAWPFEGARNAWNLAASGGANSMMNGVSQVACIPLLLIGCAVAVLRQRPSYALWMVGNVLVFTAQGFWISMPRMMLVLFPAVIALAPLAGRPVFGTLWFAGSTLLLGFEASQFAQGWWVG